MHSQHPIELVLPQLHVRLPVPENFHDLPRTSSGSSHASADHVAVHSGRKSRLDGGFDVAPVRESYEALIAPAESELLVPVVPEIVHSGPVDRVLEPHHLVDFPPPVLADPAVVAAEVLVEGRTEDAFFFIMRRS